MATVETTRSSVRKESFASLGNQKLVGRLGPWQLIRQLGEGNMTRIYLARPENSPEGQPAAYVVKMLRKEYWRDTQAIEMQRREAWIGSKISHPNLLPVLSASVSEPPFYVVTPRLPGITLTKKIFFKGQLAVPMALWIARQIAEALDALGEATGMIHADVKPDNVLISSDGHATLLDFGLAQLPNEASHWASRPLTGTLAYIAPEMVTSALASDARSDIYSLGVVLYEMLTGQRPLESDDPGELATLHREAKPPCVQELRPDLPEPTASLVHAMLAKDPLRRPDSAGQLAQQLVRLEIDSFTQR